MLPAGSELDAHGSRQAGDVVGEEAQQSLKPKQSPFAEQRSLPVLGPRPRRGV